MRRPCRQCSWWKAERAEGRFLVRVGCVMKPRPRGMRKDQASSLGRDGGVVKVEFRDQTMLGMLRLGLAYGAEGFLVCYD